MKEVKIPLAVGVMVGLIIIVLMGGCNRGDVAISPGIKGQPAPHRGYCLSDRIWVNAGDPVPYDCLIARLKGTDPNELSK